MKIARDSNVKIYPETKTPQFYAQLTGVNMEKMMVDQIKVFGFHERFKIDINYFINF